MRPKIEDFVSSLNLPYEGDYNNNGEYVVKFSNDTEFQSTYDDISIDPKFSLEQNSISDRDQAKFVFYNDWFELTFLARFDDDNYRLVIGER